MSLFGNVIAQGLSLLATVFVLAVGLAVLAVIVMFVLDISQRHDAIRRNYPVIGRFRHIFSELGEFFRQYFFAMDREEMPFNRAQRDWVNKSSAGVDNTVAFGSTQNITAPGSPIFASAIYAPLEAECEDEYQGRQYLEQAAAENAHEAAEEAEQHVAEFVEGEIDVVQEGVADLFPVHTREDKTGPPQNEDRVEADAAPQCS